MTNSNRSSRKMAELADVADAIAFQSNILALNAFVEAGSSAGDSKESVLVAKAVRDLLPRGQQSGAGARRGGEAAQGLPYGEPERVF